MSTDDFLNSAGSPVPESCSEARQVNVFAWTPTLVLPRHEPGSTTVVFRHYGSGFFGPGQPANKALPVIIENGR